MGERFAEQSSFTLDIRSFANEKFIKIEDSTATLMPPKGRDAVKIPSKTWDFAGKCLMLAGQVAKGRCMDMRRFLQICLVVLPLLAASCSPGSSSRRPPLVSFRPQDIPLVPRTVSQINREVRIDRDYMPTSTRARRYYSGSLSPRFITIHSTANPSGDACSHAKYLNKGKSGSLCWHFTVDQYHAVQHLPLNRMGHHADKGGPGDRYSIAIEMCEVRSHSKAKTYDRAAKLTASLMTQYNIPLRNVVPHYYWSGKACPGPLLDEKRPGYKWSWFISRVDYYYRCLNGGKQHVS